jgi:catechol 2,3-dioxygenase-like lactoylglutathione lyase family enzyme
MTVTEPARTTTAKPPAWSGVNHLALITPDMDATVRFYQGVLGARLVSTVGTPDFRHYFFEFGPQCTVAFFEYANLALQPFAIGAGTPDARKVQFDHLSLNLPDEAALHALRQRLIDHDCDITEIVDHGSVRSVYFSDPNGIALEASWWVKDVTAIAADYDNAGVFGDPNPVPALQELRATGALTSTGAGTRLS